MNLTGKKGIAYILKIILMIIFVICILSMIITPMFLEKGMIKNEKLGLTVVLIYISSVPALIMLYQFIKIFEQLENENIFTKIIERRFLKSSICSIIIGIIYIMNILIIPSKIASFERTSIIVYVFFSAITAVIFLMFGIGLIILREIYKTAIQNKEENDLTI